MKLKENYKKKLTPKKKKKKEKKTFRRCPPYLKSKPREYDTLMFAINAASHYIALYSTEKVTKHTTIHCSATTYTKKKKNTLKKLGFRHLPKTWLELELRSTPRT